jgi:hypothetical protein
VVRRATPATLTGVSGRPTLASALERATYPTRFDPHHRIFLREALVTVKYFSRDCVALDPYGTPRKGLLDHVAEKGTCSRRYREVWARENAL